MIGIVMAASRRAVRARGERCCQVRRGRVPIYSLLPRFFFVRRLVERDSAPSRLATAVVAAATDAVRSGCPARPNGRCFRTVVQASVAWCRTEAQASEGDAGA